MRTHRLPPPILLLFILTVLMNPGGLAGSQETEPDPEAIALFEQFVNERMAIDKAPGLSIGFFKGDRIWAKGYGFADLENCVSAKAESAYRLASITKTLTAIAVMQLVEDGKIDLDDEVQTYVPNFPRKKWPVTPRLLLGHLGGISHYKNYSVEGRIREGMNTEESLAIFREWDLVAEPGTRYHYSSYGFNLLGSVIESASGESYGDFIRKNIFIPLGMKNSRLDDPADLIANRVRGYRQIEGQIKNSEYVNISSRFAGGGTRSTVIDLLKYARGIIQGKLLKTETWNLMFTSMATRKGYFTGYGMGWNIRPWRGHFQVGHGGSQPETRTHLTLFPTEGFAIAVGCNLEGIDLGPYINRLAELILDEDLDLTVYVTDNIGQIIFNVCERIFLSGLSRYDWNGPEAGAEDSELEATFESLNRIANAEMIKASPAETRKTIEDGFHPAGQEALIRLGVYMATVLSEFKGKESLRAYRREGVLSFFRDYIQVTSFQPEQHTGRRLSDSLIRLILEWEKDWKTSYKDDIRQLVISPKTDPDVLESLLQIRFSGSRIYPDFMNNISAAARPLLPAGETDRALGLLRIGIRFYPLNPAAYAGLGSALIWSGDGQSAAKLYQKAWTMQPTHPSLSIGAFGNLAASLQQAGKTEELLLLADIALTLRAKHAGLHEDIGDWLERAGRTEKALVYYNKAFELNPKLTGIQDKIEAIEKVLKKQRDRPKAKEFL